MTDAVPPESMDRIALQLHGTRTEMDDELEQRSHNDQNDYVESDEINNGFEPHYKQREASTETLQPTPKTTPIDIPQAANNSNNRNVRSNESSFVNQFLQNHRPSITFDEEISLDSGERQPVNQGLGILQYTKPNGRSKLDQPGSISERLYSTSPQPPKSREGEGQLPPLRTTTFGLMEDSRNQRSQPIDMIRESNTNPDTNKSEPRYDEYATLSPTAISPQTTSLANNSYRSPQQRISSRPWRNGISGQSSQESWSRSESIGKSTGDSSPWLARRGTTGSYRSPQSTPSAASSFLRALSSSSLVSYGSNGADDRELPEPHHSDQEGQEIHFEGGTYVLGRQIDAGGFSIIREATLSKDGQQEQVAVKIVRRQIKGKSEIENERHQEDFEHEYRLWRLLRHPHILHLDHIHEPADAFLCFMPLNKGGTLWDFVRTNRSKGVSISLAKNYAYQLGSALHYLHLDVRAVHRDIKLENCLLDLSNGEPGLVRLCDFGMAEWITSDDDAYPSDQSTQSTDGLLQNESVSTDTSDSTFLGGSHHYVAPEIIRKADSDAGTNTSGQRPIISPGLDIWAFGVCVYSLVVGSRPFEDKLKGTTLTRILRGRWDIEKLDRGGPEVRELVSGCLTIDESQRWDISKVMNCTWFEELATTDETMQRVNAPWKL